MSQVDRSNPLPNGTSPDRSRAELSENISNSIPNMLRATDRLNKFKLAGNTVIQKIVTENSNTDDNCNILACNGRNGRGPTIPLDFKNESIKEEDETADIPPMVPPHCTSRARKCNDRVIPQRKLAQPILPYIEYPCGSPIRPDDLCIPNTLPSLQPTQAQCQSRTTNSSESTPVPSLQSNTDATQRATQPVSFDNPRISIERTPSSLDSSKLPRTGVPRRTDRPLSRIGSSSTDLLINTSPSKREAGVIPRQRKLSMPVSTTSLELPGSIHSRDRSSSPARRKFSNVSDAVTRKISSTMGWRTAVADEVVPQAKYLCSQYIRSRLKRAGLLNKKLGLQRLRSVANLQGGWEVCEVFPRVSCIGQEMERSHPKLYGSVVRQLSVSLKSDKVVRHLLLAISSHLFRTDVTWARIISLYAVAASLASDCVKQGHPELVGSVIEGVGLAIEQHSCQWIINQGGWSGVLVWSQPPAFEPTPLEMLMMVGGAGVVLAALIGGVFSLLGHLIS